MNNPKAASMFFTAVLLQLAPAALAQTGVGDDRVSLPDGPGSRDGLGDNASVNPNMGQMSTSVNIDVPAHVCTHTDIQQVCGNFLAGDGLNPYSEVGANSFWYGDLAGNDSFQFNSNGPDFAVCRADADNQSGGAAGGVGGLALYRCCY